MNTQIALSHKLCLGSFIVALFLVGCGVDAPTETVMLETSAMPSAIYGIGSVIDYGEYVAYSPGAPIITTGTPVNPTNCVMNQFNVPGQGYYVQGSGYYVQGSTGGLTTNLPTQPISATASGQDIVQTFMQNNIDPWGQLQQDAALLIVDDFGEFQNEVYEMAQEMFAFQSVFGDMTPSIFESITNPNPPLVTHGSVVLNHANNVIFGTGMYDLIEVSQNRDAFVWLHMGTDARLVVKAVSTDGFDTTMIANATMEALFGLEDDGINRGAINMSFSVIPCDTLDNFMQHKDHFESFNDYILALFDMNDISQGETDPQVLEQLSHEFAELIFAPSGSDPLHTLIQGNNPDWAAGRGNYIYVASAGNFDLPFQTFPAAWDEVVGVSASEANSGKQNAKNNYRVGFSNVGEVLDTGAWFVLEDIMAHVHGNGHPHELFYAGTSFSGPNTAVWSALDQASDNVLCELMGGVQPELAYAAQGYDPQDIHINDAVQAFCY